MKYSNNSNFVITNDSCETDFLRINDNQFCGFQQAQLAVELATDGAVRVEYKSDHGGGRLKKNNSQPVRFDLKGFKIYFEVFDLKIIFTSTAKAQTTPFAFRQGIFI